MPNSVGTLGLLGAVALLVFTASEGRLLLLAGRSGGDGCKGGVAVAKPDSPQKSLAEDDENRSAVANAGATEVADAAGALLPLSN